MKNIYFISLLLLIISCDVIVDVDMPPHQPKLVVNSVITHDSVFQASVSLSRDILAPDYQIDHVTNATVEIFKDDQLLVTLDYVDNGRYRSTENITPTESGEYRIRVSAPGQTTVEASTFLPERIQLIKGEVTFNGSMNGEFDAELIFQDEALVKNYYQVVAWIMTTYKDHQTGETFTRSYPTAITSSEESDRPENEYGRDPVRGIMIKDFLFDGKEKQIKVRGRYYKNLDQPMKLRIFLRSINEDFWKYRESADLQADINGDPLAQPVTVYSNIHNGMGILAAYSQSVLEVDY